MRQKQCRHKQLIVVSHKPSLTFDVELQIVKLGYVFKLEGLVVDRTDRALFLGALVLPHVFVNKPVVMFEMKLDVRVALSQGVIILKMIDTFQYYGYDAHCLYEEMSVISDHEVRMCRKLLLCGKDLHSRVREESCFRTVM